MQREGFDIIVTILPFSRPSFLRAPVLILAAGGHYCLYNHRLHLAAYLLLTEFGLRHNNIGSFTSNLLYHESLCLLILYIAASM
jgi:hypothetical protein